MTKTINYHTQGTLVSIDDSNAQDKIHDIEDKLSNAVYMGSNPSEEEVSVTATNTAYDIVTFESGDDGIGENWSEVETMTSGETHMSLFAKISTMFKNIRYLFKTLGNTDISNIGDGTATGAINTLNSNLDKKQNYISIGVFTGNIDMITSDGSNNTLPQNSIAWVHNTEATGNHPAEYYVLETFVAITGNNIQRATQYIYQGTPRVYTRMYVNDEWSDWDSLVNDSKLEWKLLGVYNAHSGVNVSDVDAREFFVIHSKDDICVEHQFPSNMGNGEMYGGFYNSNTSHVGETLSYVDKVIYGRVFVVSGTDHSASAIIQVYYR